MQSLAIVLIMGSLVLIPVGSIVFWPMAVIGAIAFILAVALHSATAKNGGQRL